MYATCIDTCSTLIYINFIHIQVRGGGGGGGGVRTPRTPPPCVRPCHVFTFVRMSINDFGEKSFPWKRVT